MDYMEYNSLLQEQIIECPCCGSEFLEDDVDDMGVCPECGEYIA